MPKALPAAELPFDPAMPYPIPLPFPGKWGGVTLVFDLYRVESFLDDEATYMADSLAAKQTLDRQAMDLAEPLVPAPPPPVNGAPAPPPALPPDPALVQERAAAKKQWVADFHAWERADALQQIAYFVARVDWPYPQRPPDPLDPATWAAWPLFVLKWIITPGWNVAKAVLLDPKSPTASLPSEPGAPS